MIEHYVPSLERRHAVLLFLLVTAPFFVNDFAFIATKTAPQTLIVDYAFKVFVLAMIVVIVPLRTCAVDSFGPHEGRFRLQQVIDVRTGVLILLSVAAMIAVDHFVRAPLKEIFPDTHLFRFRKIESQTLYWFDLTFGLALTAASEEFAFRAIARKVIAKFCDRTWPIFVVSSLIFAAAHWSNGVPNVIANSVIGLVLMALYWRTRSIFPPIIAHYAIGIWNFA